MPGLLTTLWLVRMMKSNDVPSGTLSGGVASSSGTSWSRKGKDAETRYGRRAGDGKSAIADCRQHVSEILRLSMRCPDQAAASAIRSEE